MGIEKFEGTIAYFVISKLAGGEVLENYSKEMDIIQPLLEYSLNYIDNFENLKSDIINLNQNLSQFSSSFKVGNLSQIQLLYDNLFVFITEIKEGDIFVVNLFNNSYPYGIIKIFLDEYINYVKQNYNL